MGRDFSSTPNYSEDMAAVIDTEVRTIIMQQYERAKEILKAHMNKVNKVAQMLYEHEKISGDDFRKIMEDQFV